MLRRLLPTLALLLLTACGATQPAASPQQPKIVLTLLDLSGSTESVRARYLAQTEQIMESVPPGARFLLLPISARSLTTPAVVDLTFPTYTWWKTNSFTYDRDTTRLQEEALGKIRAALETAIDQPGTALLDGLKRAEEFLTSYPDGSGAIYLLSDMVEQGDQIDLYNLTDEAIAPTLDSVAEKGLLPNLRGASVTVAGLEAASSLPPARVRAVQSFWEQFFESAGTKLRRYSPTLQVE